MAQHFCRVWKESREYVLSPIIILFQVGSMEVAELLDSLSLSDFLFDFVKHSTL